MKSWAEIKIKIKDLRGDPNPYCQKIRCAFFKTKREAEQFILWCKNNDVLTSAILECGTNRYKIYV